MRWDSILVATLAVGALGVAPAMAQTTGSPSSSTAPIGAPGPLGATRVVTPSMTGGIPGTFGGSPYAAGSTITGGIPGTLGALPFNAGGSTTGAIGNPSTLGTSTTSSTGLLGSNPFGGTTGTPR